MRDDELDDDWMELEREPELEKLSAVELLRATGNTVRRLVQAEVQLARSELRSDLNDQLAVVKALAIAAVAALIGVNLLFTALVLGLTEFAFAWLTALALGGAALALAAAIGAIAWRRRVREPLARTRKSLEEGIAWTQGRRS
jgi:hypothetical protein